MLKLLPPAEALGLLDHLDEHQESRVRLAVLTCRCDLDRAPGGPERHLRQALDDPDPKLVGLAIDELGERDGREATEVLAAFVEGETSAEPPPAALVERAAEALISRGDVGLHRLCGSLHRLRRSLSPARAAVGAAVRQALEPHQDDPVVAKALSRWRSSPAALLARVLPPGRPEGGGA
jgi:hypothetical protein